MTRPPVHPRLAPLIPGRLWPFPGRLTLVGTVLALASLACQVLNPTPAAWSLTSTPPAPGTEAEAPAGNTPQSATKPPVITLNPFRQPESLVPTSTQAVQASPRVWLVYATEAGNQLMLQALDGGETRQVSLPGPLLPGVDLQPGLSPDGSTLAFRTSSLKDGSLETSRAQTGTPDIKSPESGSPEPGNPEPGRLALHMLDIRTAELQTLAALLSPELERQAGQQDPKALQTTQAVSDPAGLAWSPDGRYLAYIGAADGTSADLYVYDTRKKVSTRLTRGSNQAALPYWSPDSRWIIHQEISTTTQGKSRVSAVWESAPGQPDTRRLYTPPLDSQGEVFLGWTGSGNLLAASRGTQGLYNLREVPLSARWTEPVYTHAFAGGAFDPLQGQLAFVQSSQTAPTSGLAPGVYSMALHTEDVRPVMVGSWESMSWHSAAGLFTAAGSLGALVFEPGGAVLSLQGEYTAQPSPDGQWLAGFSPAGETPGARLYNASGARLQEWLQKPVWQAAWLPDASGLYLLGEEGLFQVLFPEAKPQFVAGGVPQGWVALAALSARE